MTTTAILTAAGSGSRLGADVPKALVPINGVPMVRVAAGNLFNSRRVDELIITVPAGYMHRFTAALDDIEQPITFVIGGDTRQASIIHALKQLNPSCSKVLVHDAARPFAPPSLIANVADALDEEVKAVIPVLPVTDTIKVVETPLNRVDATASGNVEYQKDGRGWVIQTLDRVNLRAVQTPQGFDRATLENAYRYAIGHNIEATDDAGLVEAAGGEVVVISGDPAAMKITTPTDLEIATLLFGSEL